jgi:dipeptidyl aminopeptidase/acylaminoacyl peptidase
MAGMVPQDVFQLTGVADPRIAPDGATVAYVVSALDGAANEYRGAIWLAALDGSSPPRRLTAGTRRDAAPRFSPDGSQLAFTSNRAGDTQQLYVLPVGGGEARMLTDLPEDVTQPVWSPDGSVIAFVSRVRDAAYDEEDERRRAPRRFARLQYKFEHVGWTADRPQHLFTVPADGTAAPRQITAGDFEDTAPAWSPDGATLAFVSARHADWDTETVSDVYLVSACDEDDKPLRLTQGGGSLELPSWSPQGDRLAVLRCPFVLDDPGHLQVAVVDATTGAITMLTQSLDRNCGTYPNVREPVWDGDDLLFIVEDHGNVHLYRVAAKGDGAPQLVIGGEREITGFDGVAGRIVYAATDPTTAPELFAHGASGAAQGGAKASGAKAGGGQAAPARRLTHVGDAFAAGRELVAAERFTATSADGTPVEAWIMKPAGARARVRYPLLLNIHGGPFTQYGNKLFDEFQVYAGGGYAVVYCNPRGSSGYTEAWGRAIRGPGEAGPGWGTVDYDDCMAVVDEALQRFDFVDPERLGVLGGSYGGYLTSWIVGHTDRFKAAISERAVNNFVSQWGSSDTGWDFKGYIGSFVYEDIEAWLKISPITYALNIHTPLLIMHSEGDLRCPIEQGEQLFVTLRLLKRPVEMVRFPAESHELTRSGSPVHRVQRFEIVLDWFDRYLKG